MLVAERRPPTCAGGVVSVPEKVRLHRNSPPRRPDGPVQGVVAEAGLEVAVGDGGVKGRLCGSQAEEGMLRFVRGGESDAQDGSGHERSLRLTCVSAAELRRKRQVVQGNMAASRTVEGHLKDHLRGRAETQTRQPSRRHQQVITGDLLTCTEYGAFRSTCTGIHSPRVVLQSSWLSDPALHRSWYWPKRSRVKTENRFPLSSLRWYWKLRHPDMGAIVMGDTSLATSLKVLV